MPVNPIRSAVIAAFGLLLMTGGGLAEEAVAVPQLPPPTLGPQSDTSAALADTAVRLADGLRGCIARRDVADRLRCYDELSSSLPLSGTGAGAREQARRGGWVVENLRDGTPVVGLSAVSVDSDADDDAWRRSHVFLFARCTRGETELYFALGGQIAQRAGDPVAVALRLDGVQGPVETWIASTNATAVGLWRNDRSVKLLQRLFQVRRLSVRINLPKDRALFAQFDLLGMLESMSSIRGSCKEAW